MGCCSLYSLLPRVADDYCRNNSRRLALRRTDLRQGSRYDCLGWHPVTFRPYPGICVGYLFRREDHIRSGAWEMAPCPRQLTARRTSLLADGHWRGHYGHGDRPVALSSHPRVPGWITEFCRHSVWPGRALALGTGTHRSPASYAVGLGSGRRRPGMICFSSLGWGRKLYTFHIGGKDMEISEMITRVSSDRLKEELPKNLADLEVHVGTKLN